MDKTICRIDLHNHSTFSDGLQTPAGLWAEAMRLELFCFSLTDHDTNAGFAEVSAEAKKQLPGAPRLIPGAEVSTGPDDRTHVLVYGEKVLGKAMTDFFQNMAQERRTRMGAMLQKLRETGMPLGEETEQRLLSMNCAGRAALARAMAEKGYVNTVKQAFDRWIGESRPCYVPRPPKPTADFIRFAADAGCVTVLAHPMRTFGGMETFRLLLPTLLDAGLAGIECYHPSANNKTARELDALCRANKLLVTGGSDYHGDGASPMGVLPLGWPSCMEDLHALLEAMGRR